MSNPDLADNYNFLGQSSSKKDREQEIDFTATYNIQGDIVSKNDPSAPKTEFDEETSNKPRYGTLDTSNDSAGTEGISGRQQEFKVQETRPAPPMAPRGISDEIELTFLNNYNDPTATCYSHDLSYSQRNKYQDSPKVPVSKTIMSYQKEKQDELQVIINLEN